MYPVRSYPELRPRLIVRRCCSSTHATSLNGMKNSVVRKASVLPHARMARLFLTAKEATATFCPPFFLLDVSARHPLIDDENCLLKDCLRPHPPHRIPTNPQKHPPRPIRLKIYKCIQNIRGSTARSHLLAHIFSIFGQTCSTLDLGSIKSLLLSYSNQQWNQSERPSLVVLAIFNNRSVQPLARYAVISPTLANNVSLNGKNSFR